MEYSQHIYEKEQNITSYVYYSQSWTQLTLVELEMIFLLLLPEVYSIFRNH